MKRWVVFTIFACALALVISSVGAQAESRSTKLRVADKGLLGLMHRMHCDKSWLSVVMRQNNLLESDLHRLPRGLTVVIPEGCQAGLPNREDRLASSRVIAQSDAAADNSAELTSLRSEVEKARGDLSGVMQRLGQLTQDVASLQKQKPFQIPPLSTSSGTLSFYQTEWKSRIGYFTLGIALAAALGLAGFYYLRPRFVLLPKKIGRKHGGKVVAFELVDEPAHYKCPLCEANDIQEKNLERHLRRTHEAKVASVATDPISDESTERRVEA